MSEQFPIRLIPNGSCPVSAANLEAWINFETLKAGWYGDESKVLDCSLALIPNIDFEQQSKIYEGDGVVVAAQHGFALRVDKTSFKVEGIISVDTSQDHSAAQKALKTTLLKVCRILAATLALPKLGG